MCLKRHCDIFQLYLYQQDLFDDTSRHFLAILVAMVPDIVGDTLGHFPAMLVPAKPDISR